MSLRTILRDLAPGAFFPLALVVLVLGSFVVAWIAIALVRVARPRRRGRPWRLRRLFLWCAALLPVHAFVVIPAFLGLLFANAPHTRGDEAGYQGPRIASDGSWIIQSRESLRSEARTDAGGARRATDPVAPEVLEAEQAHARDLMTADGVPDRAFLVLPAGAPRFCVVLAHGLFRNALEVEPVASMFRDLGGVVLTVELRNHGGSGRAPPGFGRAEAADVLAGVACLRSDPALARLPVFLFGVSLGSAAVAYAAPRVDGLAGVVLDSPFDNARDVALRMFSRFEIVPGPVARAALFFLGIFAGTDLDAVRPAEALAGLDGGIPVLVIGGSEDWRCPVDVVHRVRAALDRRPGAGARDSAELWIREGSDHGKIWSDDPDGYRARVTRLVEKGLARSAAR